MKRMSMAVLKTSRNGRFVSPSAASQGDHTQAAHSPGNPGSGSVSIRRRRIYMRAPSTLCRQTDISDIRCQFCQGPFVAKDFGTASSVAQGKD